MSICLCHKSAEAAACVTGPRQDAFIRASRGGPWEHTVCQHRLPTAGPTPPHPRCRKRAIPTIAGPPPLSSDLDRHSKKGKTITNMLFFLFKDEHLDLIKRAICVYASSLNSTASNVMQGANYTHRLLISTHCFSSLIQNEGGLFDCNRHAR